MTEKLVLRISNATQNDEGNYRCSTKDSSGRTNYAEVPVRIHGKKSLFLSIEFQLIFNINLEHFRRISETLFLTLNFQVYFADMIQYTFFIK